MGVVITPQSEIDKYFESDALSQSSLKKLFTCSLENVNKALLTGEYFNYYTLKNPSPVGKKRRRL